MKLKIKKDVDRWILYFTFLEMMLLRWILVGQDTILLIMWFVILVRLLVLGKSTHKKIFYSMLLMIALAVYYCLRSMLVNQVNWTFFTENAWDLLEPMLYIIYFGYLFNFRMSLVKEVFSSLRKLINVYYFINFIVILLQKDETYFLMPTSRLTSTFYPDQIAGLLGIGGTHRLALFTIFVILLNAYFVREENMRGQRKIINILYIIFVIVTAFYTSSFNDNNMVYVLIPVFGLLFYMADGRNQRNRWFKGVFIAVIVFAIAYVLVSSGYLSDVLNLRIGNILKNTLATITGIEDPSDERIAHLIYAFTSCNGLFFGKGFSAMRLRQDTRIIALGTIFENFGMSDIAPLIATGGLLFYVLFLFAYIMILKPKSSPRKAGRYIFIIMLILTYYHQVLSSVTMAIPMCWIIALFLMQTEKESVTEDSIGVDNSIDNYSGAKYCDGNY